MELSTKELSLVGASLYLCEGTRSRKSKDGHKVFAVEFTNKSPEAIKMFLKFLREVVKADEKRIKAELFIYPDHNKKELMNFWSLQTKIPLSRFHKTIKLKQKNLRFKPNPLGTIKIRYFHKKHFLKIQGIIDQLFNTVRCESGLIDTIGNRA